MIIQWIKRFVRLPRTFTRWIIDHGFAPLYFAWHGVQTGTGLRVSGLPMIHNASHGKIRIGSNVKLFSRHDSNPLYVMTPCSFQLIKLGAEIEIGDHVAMSGTVICAATQVIIKPYVMIGANCTITDTDFHPLLPEERRIHPTQGAVTRPILIEEDVFIGTQSIILKGTVIGAGSMVGARSVVSGVFPPRSLIAGSPAKIIRSLDD